MSELLATITLEEEAKNPNNAYFVGKNKGKGFKGMFMKSDYKKYKERWKAEAKRVAEEIGLNEPYDGDVKIVSNWTFGTKRKKDLQNCGKLEYDALNGIIYEDDSQIMIIECYKKYKKKEPSITIEIWKI